ncbi:MAG: helix-turn-helix domain-containing protein [Candidatus Bipolaricaulis sp.]|nr:helix-turn-helix domain-containing protein [Candidatus Bipolaricaulis sp.]
MRQARFAETEIVCAVRQVALGIPTREIARRFGVSEKTVHLRRRESNGISRAS